MGRRLTDLEIVLGTQRRELQVWRRQDYCQERSSEQEQVEGLTLEQEAELLEQRRGKDFASMTERLGRLEELARCGVRSLPSLTDLPLNRVGAARTCHHLLKAGLRFSNSYSSFFSPRSRQSGHYFIDPDGPGVGAPPVQVFKRRMEIDNVCTLIGSRCTVTCDQAQQGWATTSKESRR